MSHSPPRHSLAVWILLLVVFASLAFATPWAAHFRQSVGPQLPLFVVILATLTGVGQLVVGAVAGLGKHGGWNAAVLPIMLGLSASSMALSFLPGAPGTAPRLLPIIGAAFFALIAAVLQRRARERLEL